MDKQTGAGGLLLAGVCLLALAASGHGMDLKSLDKYIRLPQVEADSFNVWLQNIGGYLEPDSEPQSLVEQLTKARHAFENWEDLMKYDMLLGIAANPKGNNCPHEIVGFFLAIYRFQQQDAKLAPIRKYLDHYGALKFSNCAWEALHEIRHMAKPKVEREMDEFFARALSLDRRPGDAMLFAYLDNFNITSHEMDVKQMGLASLYPVHRKRLASESSRIIWFIVKKCDQFQAAFGRQLDFINLANALDPKMQYLVNSRLHKLNEFNRICLDQSQHKTALVHNIKRQAESSR